MQPDEHFRSSVVIIDDHAALRDGLGMLLQRAGFAVVGTTGDPERALGLARSRRPDVIVLDLDLDGEDGMAWLDRYRSACPESRILIYTAAAEPGVLEAAADLDAAGIALKACSSAEFVEAVRAVADGRRYLDVRITEILRDGVGDDLSRRERQILGLLAAGLTGEQAAERLFVSPETVRTHVRNAMRKLGAKTRARAIVLALKNGRIKLPREEEAA
jgi:DNA-binding NarL/FixJ family response regulator